MKTSTAPATLTLTAFAASLEQSREKWLTSPVSSTIQYFLCCINRLRKLSEKFWTYIFCENGCLVKTSQKCLSFVKLNCYQYVCPVHWPSAPRCPRSWVRPFCFHQNMINIKFWIIRDAHNSPVNQLFHPPLHAMHMPTHPRWLALNAKLFSHMKHTQKEPLSHALWLKQPGGRTHIAIHSLIRSCVNWQIHQTLLFLYTPLR